MGPRISPRAKSSVPSVMPFLRVIYEKELTFPGGGCWIGSTISLRDWAGLSRCMRTKGVGRGSGRALGRCVNAEDAEVAKNETDFRGERVHVDPGAYSEQSASLFWGGDRKPFVPAEVAEHHNRTSRGSLPMVFDGKLNGQNCVGSPVFSGICFGEGKSRFFFFFFFFVLFVSCLLFSFLGTIAEKPGGHSGLRLDETRIWAATGNG